MSIADYSLWSATVTVLALLVYMYMTINVGVARGKTGILPPAMTGAPELERAVRVHSNTLEAMPLFLVGLWLATIYFSPSFPVVAWLPAVLGLVWCIGRIMYMQGYMAAPEKRSMGYLISALPMLVNLILGIVGIVAAFMAVSV
jgi:glutathione S-transferase